LRVRGAGAGPRPAAGGAPAAGAPVGAGPAGAGPGTGAAVPGWGRATTAVAHV